MDKTDYTQYSHLYVKLEDEESIFYASVNFEHVHFLIGVKPGCCLSDLVSEIKKSSNEFINENKLTQFKFQMREGYGAFHIAVRL